MYLKAIASRRRVQADLALQAAGGAKPCQGFHTAAATARPLPSLRHSGGGLLRAPDSMTGDDSRSRAVRRMVTDCPLREKG